jgi:hypothetical protein
MVIGGNLVLDRMIFGVFVFTLILIEIYFSYQQH